MIVDKRNPNNVRVTGKDMVTGIVDMTRRQIEIDLAHDAVYDAAMAEWRARCHMVDNPTSENCDAWNEAVDAANEACRRAEEVERGD